MPRPDPALQPAPRRRARPTPLAGAFSDFHLKLDRDDGDQFLGDLNFKMPPGFTGDLRGITYCPEAAIAAAAAEARAAPSRPRPSCPASSQIGTTNVAAGPGSHPFHAVGRMYLAGPFKGAPLSLVAITPALAGPYDYGIVVVRVALHVDPLDRPGHRRSRTRCRRSSAASRSGCARSRSTSTSPNFTINPTNCAPFSVDSQGIGDQGTVADFSSYFHAVNCATLAVQAEDDDPPGRQPKATPAQPRTRRSSSTSGPARATPTSSRSR